MAHVCVDVKLTNLLARETVFVSQALVDTGATFTTVPQDMAEKLKLEPHRTVKVQTANGVQDLEESHVLIELKEERTVTPVLISPTLDQVLIGALTLEALAFKVDPKTAELEKTAILLYWKSSPSRSSQVDAS